MKTVEKITIDELKAFAERMYEPLVKAVVDVERNVLVVDAGLHSDEELYLLEQGARDEFLRLFYDRTFDDDADNIERYFLYFAWLARSRP